MWDRQTRQFLRQVRQVWLVPVLAGLMLLSGVGASCSVVGTAPPARDAAGADGTGAGHDGAGESAAADKGAARGGTGESAAADRAAADAAAREGSAGRVVTVIDGDTVDVRTYGSRLLRVRLLGIDAPELASQTRPAVCGGEQARARARRLLAGRPVSLVTDRTQVGTDRFGRRLAYLVADGEDIGMRLVMEGWATAWHPARQNPPARDQRYRSAQAIARGHRRGIWGLCPAGDLPDRSHVLTVS